MSFPTSRALWLSSKPSKLGDIAGFKEDLTRNNIPIEWGDDGDTMGI